MSQRDYWAHYRAQRRRLLALEQQVARELHALWQMVPKRLRPQIDALVRDYSAELDRIRDEEDNPHATVSQTWIKQRLTAFERVVHGAVASFATTASHRVTAAQGQAIRSGASDAHDLLTAAIEPLLRYGVTAQAAHPNALLAMQGRLANGQPLATLFDSFGADAAVAARQALMAGMASGSNPSVVARLLDTALGISRSHALTIARTEMLGSYRAAALAGYRANSDVVGGWIWQCADDGRCCAMCAAMQGSEHSLDDTLDSHPNCRCAMLPKTKSYADILGPLGIDASGIPETSISVQSGEDWFASLDASQQRSILGTQAGYDAYVNGDVSLSDFVGVSHDDTWGTSRYQKSLKQLGISPQ